MERIDWAAKRAAMLAQVSRPTRPFRRSSGSGAARRGRLGLSAPKVDPRVGTLKSAYNRARKQHIPFSLTLADIGEVPAVCPVLGIDLAYAGKVGGDDNSPSLMRIDANRGFLPGNVQLVSNKAHRILAQGSLEELEAAVSFIRGLRTQSN